jgi:serine/threonine protein kinase
LKIEVGRQLLHYRLIEKIGEGGMGVVWKAEDTRLHRHVALKLVPEVSAQDEQAVDRHLREARAASALNHPHICSIHDIGEFEGSRFIVMELLEGQSLQDRIGGKALVVETAVDLATQIADALAAAHDKGIVHRDIKSANIFVVGDQTASPHAKMLDFGLAKLAGGPTHPSSPDDPTRTELDRTAPGSVVGTVAYMSPEQALGKELDHRTDIFSLGVVLYEMITGRRAFAGNTSAAVFDAILNRAPTAPVELNARVPGELQRIVHKALEKDPDLRYQSAAELRADLKRLQRDSHSSTGRGSAAQSKPKSRFALAAGVAIHGRRRSFIGRRADNGIVEGTVDRGAAVCERQRRSGAGLLQQRSDRGDRHRADPLPRSVRDRTSLDRRVRGRYRGPPAGQRRPGGRALRLTGKRAQGGGHGPGDRRAVGRTRRGDPVA